MVFPQKYHYIELTAGKGFSPSGEKGSPLVFIEIAESKNIRYYIDFIECNQKNISCLEKILFEEKQKQEWQNAFWNFHCGKYQSEIQKFLNSDSNELGLVFVDHSGDLPDFPTLELISQLRPKMELLIYLPSTNVKRTYRYTEKHLKDYIESIGKKNWLIRKPLSWDRHKWTFLLGSNSNIFSTYKSINFYKLDSDIGQAVFKQINLTTKEQLEAIQPKLFD